MKLGSLVQTIDHGLPISLGLGIVIDRPSPKTLHILWSSGHESFEEADLFCPQTVTAKERNNDS